MVFYGSARILDPKDAKRKLLVLQKEANNQLKPSVSLRRQIERVQSDLEMSAYYRDAMKLAEMLTRWSSKLDGGKRFIVCSGGGPGIMEAANRGAKKAGGPTIGLNISLPFEQIPNPYISPELNFEFHYFFMRKFWFAYLAKALVVFPGGYGTLDELFELLTLVQTKKIEKPLAILIYGKKYWDEIIDFEAMAKHHMISPEDLQLFSYADKPEEAFEYLREKLERYYLK
ncbi:MAG TPA: TIGR00730 family Rossman fold protein [bacterium]|nr:TIGR00730 family Rossman fold protein [bacterium]